MRRAGGARPTRRPTAAVPDRAPPPSPFDAGALRRDSDASSRPSSVGSRSQAAAPTDRASQAAALRFVNSYLSSHSLPFSLHSPYPSAREIVETLRFLLSRLDFPVSDLESELLFVLHCLGCPHKLKKSVLKAPGTPHAWPPLLAVIQWLVQIARYLDHRAAPSTPDSRPSNDLLNYVLQSYNFYISGEDDAVTELDNNYMKQAEDHANKVAAGVDALKEEAAALEVKLQALSSAPSRREALESERALLVEDAKKFQKVLDTNGMRLAAMELRLGEREKDLEAKEREREKLREENAELKKRVDDQALNASDAERIKRELQVIQRDIAEAESGRNEAEEKVWELDADIDRKLKDLTALAAQCNAALRKLKLATDFQYELNTKGTSPAEVIGNYRTALKPVLRALAEDTKRSSVSKLEGLLTLQERSQKNSTVIDEKRNLLTTLQARVEEAEGRVSLLKKKIKDYSLECAAEAEMKKEEFQRKEDLLAILENEAEDFLKASEEKLQGATRETDEETQLCARELLATIDAVSECKEYMESIVSGMKKDLGDTVRALSEAHKASVSARLVSCGLKRARSPSLK